MHLRPFLILAFIFSLFLLGCGTAEKKENEVEVSTAGSSTLGNIRFAFLNPKINLILVNEGSNKYLKIQDKFLKEDRQEIPFSAYTYNSKTLPLNEKNNIRIVENQVMAQLLNFASQRGFFTAAKSFNIKNIAELKGDHLMIEKNGQYFLLSKGESMRDNTPLHSQATIYRDMKVNLFMAPGYDIFHVRQGLGSGRKWLKRN